MTAEEKSTAPQLEPSFEARRRDMGLPRVPLQLKGCPVVYIFTLTHYAIGGVAVQYLHLQGSPPPQHISAVWSCCFHLHLCWGAPSFLSTSSWSVFFYEKRWYLCLQTPFPPCCSRLRTLRRPLRSPGLAGGIRRRRSSTMLSLLSSISFCHFRIRAFLPRVRTLLPLLPWSWPS